MNKYIIYTCLFLLLGASCRQDFVEMDTFDVRVEKTTVNVGDTVVFEFLGNPDFITFYSGENGKKYENKDRTSVKGKSELNFTSLFANGAQSNTLKLMVSSDFLGVESGATTSNISKANWTDISGRVAWSTGKSTASGAIDLSDFAVNEKSVYIAFKYVAESGSIQPKWTISNLTVSNVLADATYTLANLTASTIANYGNSSLYSPGWVAGRVTGNVGWVIGTTLVITGATSVGAATSPSEAWTFTGPIDLNKVTVDLGTYLKGMDTRLDSYVYTYPAAGTYSATFVASANNVYGINEEVRIVELTVNP
ncbi:MAG: DUF5017 domain-containing protein [Mangrovibacterium sp.]